VQHICKLYGGSTRGEEVNCTQADQRESNLQAGTKLGQ